MVKMKETEVPASDGAVREMIDCIRNRSSSRSREEHIRVCDIPPVTQENIENALNSRFGKTATLPGTFRIGGLIGKGGSSSVYKLLYSEAPISSNADSDDMDDLRKEQMQRMKKSYVVKVTDPIEMYCVQMEKNRQDLQITLSELRADDSYLLFEHERKKYLPRIKRFTEAVSADREACVYRPELSFEMPWAEGITITVIVMNEITCTLNELALPERMNDRIRLMFKAGKEIGTQLQMCEYPKKSPRVFIHRDVKLGNIGVIFPASTPDYFKFVLIDCECGSIHEENGNTQISTPGYSSPLIQAGESLNHNTFRLSDQHALGRVLIKILGFETEKDLEKLPAYIIDVLQKATAYYPAEQFRDFREFVSELEKAERMYLSEAEKNGSYGGYAVNLKDEYDRKLEEKDRECRESLHRKEQEFKTVADNYEKLLKEKDKELERLRKKSASPSKKTAGQLKKPGSEPADKAEQLKMCEAEIRDLKKQLAERNHVLKSEWSADDKSASQARLINDLSRQTDAYKKAFAKTKPAENTAPVQRIVTCSGGRKTFETEYTYHSTKDGCEVTVNHIPQNSAYAWEENLVYDKDGRLIAKTSGNHDSRTKTVYSYRKDLITAVKILNPEGTCTEYKYTYDYSRDGSGKRIPTAVIAGINGIRACCSDWNFHYDYWPDQSVMTQTISAAGNTELFGFSKKITRYSPNGLPESEEIFGPDSSSFTRKLYYDTEGKLVHEDIYSSKGALETSTAYVYDTQKRRSIRTEHSHVSGTYSQSFYTYAEETPENPS